MNILTVIKSKACNSDRLDQSGISIFLNPFTYLKIRKHINLLERVDHIFIDGQWLCHFLKWFNIVDIERISFDNTSVAPIVFGSADAKKQTVALIGSDQESAQSFERYVTSTYPNLVIIYSRNGYFTEPEYKASLQDVLGLKPDLIVVGMGFLKQEKFLVDLFDIGYTGIAFTCGGFIHQTASKGHKYYPTWINKMNLRFAYRIWDEPKLLKRYTLDYIKFALVFLSDVAQLRRKK